MLTKKRAWVAMLGLLILGCITQKASAVELGLTPSHVVGLWTNVNAALIVYAEQTGAKDQAAQMKTMRAQSFQGKKPSDVLGEVVRFRERLDRLKQSSNLKATQIFGAGTQKINPSIVFMNSGFVLDSAVELVISVSDDSVMISPLFAQHEISGKKPSDAFAMVDLAHRRLDLIAR